MNTNRAPDGETSRPIERKIQLAGNSTFVVSLPKEWAVEQNLESGESMFLYPHEDRLVAAPGTVSGRDRTHTIDADGVDEDAILRRARTAYLAGYDRITIDGASTLDTATRRALERTIGRLMGLEIETMTDDAITARNLLDVDDVSLPQTITQARQLTLEMCEDAITALRTNDDRLATRVIAREDDVDRLFAFVSRGFHRGLEDVHELGRLETDRTVAFRNYRIGRGLERIADHAEAIAGIVARQSSSPEAEVADTLEAIGSDARRVTELGSAGETDRALEFRSDVCGVIDRFDWELQARRSGDEYLYGAVVRSLRRTAEIGWNITLATAESSLEH